MQIDFIFDIQYHSIYSISIFENNQNLITVRFMVDLCLM